MEAFESILIFFKLLFRDIFKGKQTKYNKSQANAHFNLGNKFMENKQLDRAREEYQKALQFFPYHLDALINLGIIYYHKSLTEKALDSFVKAYNIDPHNARAAYWVGRLNFEREKFNKAEKFLRRAIKFKKNFLEAHYYLGLLYLDKNMYEFAIENLEKTLKIDPSWVDAYLPLGKAYYKIEQYSKAKELLEKAIESLGEDAELLLHLGYARLACNDTNGALKAAQKALKLNDSYSELHYLLSKIYNKKGEKSLALEEQVKAINLDPASMLNKISQEPDDLSIEDIPRILAVTLFVKEIIDNLKSYIEQIKIILALIKYKRYKLAITQLNYLFMPDRLISFRLLQAKKYLDRNNYKEAERLLKLVIEIFPEYIESYIHLGDLYTRQSKPTKGIEYLSKALPYSTDNPFIYFKLGSLYSKINNHSEAIKNFEKVLNFKNLPEALKMSYYLLAEIYTTTDNIDKALEVLRKSNKFKNEAQIYAMLGHRLVFGTNEEAYLYKGLDLALKGYEMDKEESRIWEVIGISHYKLNNKKEALEWLNKISEPSSEIKYYLGKLKEEAGLIEANTEAKEL